MTIHFCLWQWEVGICRRWRVVSSGQVVRYDPKTSSHLQDSAVAKDGNSQTALSTVEFYHMKPPRNGYSNDHFSTGLQATAYCLKDLGHLYTPL